MSINPKNLKGSFTDHSMPIPDVFDDFKLETPHFHSGLEDPSCFQADPSHHS